MGDAVDTEGAGKGGCRVASGQATGSSECRECTGTAGWVGGGVRSAIGSGCVAQTADHTTGRRNWTRTTCLACPYAAGAHATPSAG